MRATVEFHGANTPPPIQILIAQVGRCRCRSGPSATEGLHCEPLSVRPVLPIDRSARSHAVLEMAHGKGMRSNPHTLQGKRTVSIRISDQVGLHRCRICSGTGLSPVASVPGTGLTPLPCLRQDWAHPLPHLRPDWAHPCHICAGTG
jgi:hypothetical protein